MKLHNAALLLMLSFSIIFDIFKHWGNWLVFGIFLSFQVAMLSTMNTYFNNRSMSIGMMSLAPDSDPTSRKLFFLTAAFAYLLLFFL